MTRYSVRVPACVLPHPSAAAESLGLQQSMSCDPVTGVRSTVVHCVPVGYGAVQLGAQVLAAALSLSLRVVEAFVVPFWISPAVL